MRMGNGNGGGSGVAENTTKCKSEIKAPLDELVSLSEQIGRINHNDLWIGNNVRLISDFKQSLYSMESGDKVAFVSRFVQCHSSGTTNGGCDMQCKGYKNKLSSNSPPLHDFYEGPESAICTHCGHKRLLCPILPYNYVNSSLIKTA